MPVLNFCIISFKFQLPLALIFGKFFTRKKESSVFRTTHKKGTAKMFKNDVVLQRTGYRIVNPCISRVPPRNYFTKQITCEIPACNPVNVKKQAYSKISSFFGQLFLILSRTNIRETIFEFEKFNVSLQITRVFV